MLIVCGAYSEGYRDMLQMELIMGEPKDSYSQLFRYLNKEQCFVEVSYVIRCSSQY